MIGRAEILVTRHALERVGKRCPFKKNRLLEIANKAMDFGIRACDAKDSRTRNYLRHKMVDACHDIYAYGGFLFIFTFSAGAFHLKTVIPVEPSYAKGIAEAVRE